MDCIEQQEVKQILSNYCLVKIGLESSLGCLPQLLEIIYGFQCIAEYLSSCLRIVKRQEVAFSPVSKNFWNTTHRAGKYGQTCRHRFNNYYAKTFHLGNVDKGIELRQQIGCPHDLSSEVDMAFQPQLLNLLLKYLTIRTIANQRQRKAWYFAPRNRHDIQ